MISSLSSIEYYLPDNVLSNEKINEEHPEWSVVKISKKTGIFNRRIASKNEFSSDLGIKAAEKIFKNSSFNKSDIDFLIFCTQSPDYMIPTTACIIQDKLKLRNNIGAIDINMGCSGYVFGLSYAKGLIASGQAHNVLFITGETYSKHINKSDKKNKTIFGDAGSASIITSNNTESSLGEIQDFVFFTNGEGYDKLIVKNSGLKNKDKRDISESLYDESGEFLSNDNNLFMDGKAIFEFTSFKVPVVFKKLLDKNKTTLNEIDLFIFHQANAYMMEFMRRRCEIPKDKFYIYLKDCGNTVSATLPIALKEAQKEGKIKKGSRVLLLGFGVGLSIGGTIIQF